MSKKIENQMISSTPSNLLSIESINKLLSLFYKNMDNLTEFSSEPLDIYNVDKLQKKYLETKNTNILDIKKEHFKIFVQEIFEVFNKVQDSEEIYNRFNTIYKALNIHTDNLIIKPDLDKAINTEVISSSTSYKAKKGTKGGFEFVYDLIKKTNIQSINSDGVFNLIELNPFEYAVETSLYKEVYKETVVPLAHPVGFIWLLIRILSLDLKDYYSYEEETILKSALLTCYSLDGVIREQEIIKSKIFGEFKKFYKNTNTENKEEVIIDFYPLIGDGNGYRFVRHYNNSNKLYDRQYYKNNEVNLELVSVENLDDTQGKLDVYYKSNGYVDYISFTENTIIDKESFRVKYKILDSDEDNEAIIKFKEKEVNEDNKKVFIAQNFTPYEILNSLTSYNGKVIKDYGVNCTFSYEDDLRLTNIVTDVSEYVRNTRPLNNNLAMDVRDIESSDPNEIKKLYSNIDHTLEETDTKTTYEYWGRLSPYNTICLRIGDEWRIGDGSIISKCLNRYIRIGDEGLKIGNEWRIGGKTRRLHIFDIGYNNIKNRWENFYAPSAQEDLLLLGKSLELVNTYIKQNLENADYTAHEFLSFEEEITMFKKQMCGYLYENCWTIGDGTKIGDTNKKIGCDEIPLYVDAEVYGDIQDNFIFETESNFRDNIITNEEYSTQDTKNITDYYYIDGSELTKIDGTWSIGDGTTIIKEIDYDYEFDFGVYRYNEDTNEWERLEDDNRSVLDN